jgi:hypothetical protein
VMHYAYAQLIFISPARGISLQPPITGEAALSTWCNSIFLTSLIRNDLIEITAQSRTLIIRDFFNSKTISCSENWLSNDDISWYFAISTHNSSIAAATTYQRVLQQHYWADFTLHFIPRTFKGSHNISRLYDVILPYIITKVIR